jgi:hypothetical protein
MDRPEIGHGGPRAKKTLVVLPRRYQNELLVKVCQSCRLIFFGGVEGILCCHICIHSQPGQKIFLPNCTTKITRWVIFSTYNETVRSSQTIRIKQLMADADRSIREQGGGILPLNVLSEGTSGMMSYPNLFGADRTLQYIRVG